MKRYRIIEVRNTETDIELRVDITIEAENLQELNKLLQNRKNVFVNIADITENNKD